jgi:hypothetical protein
MIINVALLNYIIVKVLDRGLLTSDFRNRSSIPGRKSGIRRRREVQIDEKGKIINVSKTYGGRKHDYVNRKYK